MRIPCTQHSTVSLAPNGDTTALIATNDFSTSSYELCDSLTMRFYGVGGSRQRAEIPYPNLAVNRAGDDVLRLRRTRHIYGLVSVARGLEKKATRFDIPSAQPWWPEHFPEIVAQHGEGAPLVAESDSLESLVSRLPHRRENSILPITSNVPDHYVMVCVGQPACV